MNTALVILLCFLVAPLVLYAGLALGVGRDRVWATLLGPGDRVPVDIAAAGRHRRPNRYLVGPPGAGAGGAAGAESPVFPVPAERLRAAVDAQLAEMGARVLEAGGDRIEAEVRTPFLRFPDLITVWIIPVDGERTTLAVLSRSVYGYSDLGTNRRRVIELLAGLDRRVR